MSSALPDLIRCKFRTEIKGDSKTNGVSFILTITNDNFRKPPRPVDDQVVLEDTGGSKSLQNDLPFQRSSQTNSRKLNKNEINQHCNDQNVIQNQIRGKNLISGAP